LGAGRPTDSPVGCSDAYVVDPRFVKTVAGASVVDDGKYEACWLVADHQYLPPRREVAEPRAHSSVRRSSFKAELVDDAAVFRDDGEDRLR
jgi:hypothetical protein